MHNFINNWRAYIIAENEQLLAEDRYDDAAKKYPDLGKQKIAVLMGDTILDYFKKNDPEKFFCIFFHSFCEIFQIYLFYLS